MFCLFYLIYWPLFEIDENSVIEQCFAADCSWLSTMSNNLAKHESGVTMLNNIVDNAAKHCSMQRFYQPSTSICNLCFAFVSNTKCLLFTVTM